MLPSMSNVGLLVQESCEGILLPTFTIHSDLHVSLAKSRPLAAFFVNAGLLNAGVPPVTLDEDIQYTVSSMFFAVRRPLAAVHAVLSRNYSTLVL